MKEADSTIEFLSARNGQETCRLDKKYFHSAYNPENEARSFVSSIDLDFNPSSIVIIEPALSYCAPFLRQRFPKTKLYALRLTEAFSKTDSLWDKVFSWKESNFSQELFSAMGEDELLSAGFFAWPGSKNIFDSQISLAWQGIKDAVLLARDVMNTRAHFSEKWLLNSTRFFFNLDKYCLPERTSKNILVAASGPSLEESIGYIKEYRPFFYLICVSSALSVLLFNKIRPDMIISTDGGYWAKKHLEIHKKDLELLKDTVLAIPDEACCPATLLKKLKVLPLFYPGSAGEAVYKNLGIKAFPALRNGTVSGTAAALALSSTARNVYFCGLDLSPSHSFQHTNPNALENRAMTSDRRLATKETRQTAARFSSEGSLALYRNWFKSQPESFCSRVFRLHEKESFLFSLLPVKDELWEDIIPKLRQAEPERAGTSEKQSVPLKERKQKILESFYEVLTSKKFKAEIFPLEALMERRAKTKEERNTALEKMEAKKQALEKKIRRILG